MLFFLTGHAIPQFDGNVITVTDGSSASSPFFAGILSEINQQLKELGYPPIGFLNPNLYEMYQQDYQHSLFYDIVEGFSAPCPLW